MAFAANYQAFRAAFQNKIFDWKKDKTDAIVNGEYGFTRDLLARHMNIDSQLLKYGQINCRDKKNWNCNQYLAPNRFNTYFGSNELKICIHPLETVFLSQLGNKLI